jgi:hypothetical protein
MLAPDNPGTVAAADDADTCAKQSGDIAIAACSRAEDEWLALIGEVRR